ncbi:MAG: PaaI family thioesterase [Nocardioides sp.]
MTSIQEQFFSDGTCFGCGPANPKGLQIKSYADDDGLVRARFTGWPEHDNGLGFLNGGIIATVLDCHSAAAVILTANERGWPALPGAALPYVTAGLQVRYLRPTPHRDEVLLVAEILTADEAAMTAKVWIEHDGKPRAEAEALWKRWRPRP